MFKHKKQNKLKSCVLSTSIFFLMDYSRNWDRNLYDKIILRKLSPTYMPALNRSEISNCRKCKNCTCPAKLPNETMYFRPLYNVMQLSLLRVRNFDFLVRNRVFASLFAHFIQIFFKKLAYFLRNLGKCAQINFFLRS